MEGGTEPGFRQVGSIDLYALSSAADTGLPGYWAGYRPNPSSRFGETVTLDQAWNDSGGVYLFLNATPSDFGAFLTSLEALLARVSPTGGVRFLWLADPNQAPALWQFQTLQAAPADGGWKVLREARFALGEYELDVDRGAVLTPATAPSPGWGVGVDSVRLLAPGGGYASDAGTAWLPLAGQNLGAWTAALTLAGSEGGDDLARLGVELRYSTPAEEGAVAAVPMPILRQNGAPLKMGLAFDPLNLLAPDRTQPAPPPCRTRLDFAAGSPALGSTLLTTLGYPTTLTPLAAPSSPLWAARLAFCFNPLLADAVEDEAFRRYHLAPDGAFTLGSKGERLALGLSGIECVEIPASGELTALFEAGREAFAPASSGKTPAAEAEGAPPKPLLSGHGTTAYATFLPSAPGAGLTYYAQPRQAPLHVPGAELGKGFMKYHEMPAATLPAPAADATAAPATLPVGAYAGVPEEDGALARALEQRAIAPARRAAIGLPTERADAEADGGPPLAVTPQGLVSILSASGEDWEGVVLANMRSSGRQLAFSPVGPNFQAALQSNEVFFVASDPKALMTETSVEYRLDPATLELLPAAGVPPQTVQALEALLKPQGYPTFPTEDAFAAAIEPTAGKESMAKILPVAGQLIADVEDWNFQLSPRSWRTEADSPTMMLVKYCSRSLEELVADTAGWGWPAAAADASGSLATTQATLQEMFTAAAAAPSGTPYARFYSEVVSNPWWNGILFLNAPVAIAQFPPELQFLTAGIESERFYAHHVGFSLTPFEAAGEGVALGQTAVFGLIDYSDPADLVLTSNVPLAFKTNALRVRFANAAVADFSAEVELMVNRLFGALLTKADPARGNNLVLHGSYQRQNGKPTYAFTLEGKNEFAVAASALQSIEVLGVQLQTATGTAAASTVAVDFVLAGNLRFVEPPEFDPFCWGPERGAPPGQQPADGWLRFGNLAVRMSFDLATPRQQTFDVGEQRLSFDLANSRARPRSLAASFPVSLTGFLASPKVMKEGKSEPGQKPEDLGYGSVLAPLDQSTLEPPWYGLVLTLSLGTLGAAGGGVPLSLSVLAAWAPGSAEEQPVYLGIGLPGAHASGIAWSLEGVLRFGFRTIQFQAAEMPGGKRAYTLLLRRLALSVLGWSFPPGNADVYLFGNPEGDPKAALGWYAAYDGTDPKKPARLAEAGVRRIAAGGR